MRRKIDTSIYICPAGCPIQPIYGYRYDDKGVKRLEVIDKVDFNLKIQTYAPMCDFKTIIARASMGDTSVLNVRKGFYGDVTGMPSTMAEMYQKYNDSQVIFEKLPVALKEKFNNSFEQFWSEYGSEKFEDKFAEFEHNASLTNSVKYKGAYYSLDDFKAKLGITDIKEGVDNE